jgi:ELWxxDGT repeat protein
MMHTSSRTRPLTVEALESRELPAATLLANIRAGQWGSYPTSLTVSGDRMYFVAENTLGRELYVTDGTPTGTRLVKDINPTPGHGSNPERLQPDGQGGLFFLADDGSGHGEQLWKTDGTSAGTVSVATPPVTDISNRLTTIPVNGRNFFLVTTAQGGYELWADYPPAGTIVLLRTFPPPTNGSGPRNFIQRDGVLYFLTAGEPGKVGLWRSDGTAVGTKLVAETGLGAGYFTLMWDVTIAAGGNFYYLGLPRTDTWTPEVWSASPATGKFVKVFGLDTPGYGTAGDVVSLGGKLFFTAGRAEDGLTLWTTDGTVAGTHRVTGPWSTHGSLSGRWEGLDPNGPLRVFGNRLVFSTADGAVWAGDGTAAGTAEVTSAGARLPGPAVEVVDYQPPSVAHPRGFVFVRSSRRDSQGQDREAFAQADGTPAGTRCVSDTPPGGAFVPNPYIDVRSRTDFRGAYYLTADDGLNGAELWRIGPDPVAPPPAPPTVKSVVVNDGSAQRSMVKSLTVTFDRAVSLAAGAFDLRDASGRSLALTAASGPTSFRITFSGPGVIGGSLADGNYTLTVHADRATGATLDGDNNGLSGGDRVEKFFRLFGDLNGDRYEAPAERSAVKRAVGTRAGQPGYDAAMDFNSDGLIGPDDDRQAASRYQKRLPA